MVTCFPKDNDIFSQTLSNYNDTWKRHKLIMISRLQHTNFTLFFYLLGIALKCNCFKYILQCTWMVFILGMQWLNNSRCFVLLTLPCQSNWGVNDKFRTHWLLHKHFQNYTNVRVPCINSVSEIFWIVICQCLPESDVRPYIWQSTSTASSSFLGHLGAGLMWRR